MNISQNGLAIIKQWEGFRPLAYPDIAGILTIGYGHTNNTASAAQYPVYEGETITEGQANTILLADVSNYVAAVNNAVTAPINQNQFDALVSFTYNLGIGAFDSSDLLTYVNESNFDAAAQQFLLYVHSNGQVQNGLVNRRTQERNLFLSNSNDTASTSSAPTGGVNNGLITYSGVFVPNQTLQVSADTDPNSPAVATYDAGEQIPYDSYVLANGYAWISYIGQSGQRRYVAVGPDDGSPSTTWGTGFFNNGNSTTNNNNLISYSGIFTPNQTLQVSADTDPNSPAIATYDAGEQIPYDSYILVNGYAWISYIGQSGQRRYVAVGPDDGSSSTTWGTGFFN